MTRYKQDESAIQEKARELERERDVSAAKARQFHVGEVFLEVAIVLLSLTILTKASVAGTRRPNQCCHRHRLGREWISSVTAFLGNPNGLLREKKRLVQQGREEQIGRVKATIGFRIDLGVPPSGPLQLLFQGNPELNRTGRALAVEDWRLFGS